MGTHNHSHDGPHHHDGTEPKAAPAWKRVHHSWIFWVGVVLTFAAILTYVLSMDLAWRPRAHLAQPPPINAVGK